MNDKTKMNMAAAKMLGLMRVELLDGEVEYQKPANTESPTANNSGYKTLAYVFDIFTNPSDCQAAVKCLGVEHGVMLCPFMAGTNRKGWRWKRGFETSDIVFKTYEEAVGAACVAVVDGE